MRTRRFSAFVVAALVASTAAAAASPPSVLGVRGAQAGVVVQRYDRATLRPFGPTLRIGANAWSWSRSPDGRTVALAGGQRDRPGVVVFVDVATLRRIGRFRFAAGYPGGLRWVAPERLLLVTGTEAGGSVRLVDPLARRQLDQVSLPGRVARGARTAEGLALLLGPQQGVGPAQLVLVDGSLSVRSVSLTRIRVGWEVPQPVGVGSSETPARMRVPGLAVDPTGTRAVVAGAGEPVAEIDLRTGAVTYHPVLERRPAAAAKAISGPNLSAVWLPGEKVAVTGTVYGGLDETTRALRRDPFGLVLLDTRAWRSRLVPGLSGFLRAGPWLVAPGPAGGLDWYDAGGGRRGHLLGRWNVTDSAWIGERGIVRSWSEGKSFVVDLRRGRVLGGTDLVPPLFLDVEPAGFPG